jgi:hypothetical protein
VHWAYDPQKVAEESTKRLLKAAQVELTKEVRLKLTYEYLGIWTGTLRNTTGAQVKDGVLYFGTNTNYGYAYETGDWRKVPQNKLYYDKYLAARKRRAREAEIKWRGKRKRPFLLDTIHDEGVQARILARVRNANV